MERRKMFLATILIVLILFQSVLPFTVVNAATSNDVVITSSRELYAALKEELDSKGIEAVYDLANYKISIPQSEIAKVTELDLSNSEIDDLTGLGNFTNVTKLNLTSNELTVDSNLKELDKLPLKNLNLSSNQIESVDSITKFDGIEYSDITNQQIEKRDIIQLDISEESSHIQRVVINLPNVLLEDGGEIKAEWLDYETTEGCSARVDWSKFNPRNTVCELVVAAGTENSYTPYKGLLTITAKIEDSSSKLYNTNITLYYAIIDSEETGICFNDDYLYEAVKEQLTAGQDVNEELDSYFASDVPVTLYKEAYDQAKIMVIDTNTLINDIPSLILNDQKIEDLTGLEEFIGLESELDLSYNYIDSLEKILELEENKETAEKELRERYKKAAEKVQENRSLLIGLESQLEEYNKTIQEARDELAKLDRTAEDFASQSEELLKTINETNQLKANVEVKVQLYKELVSAGLEKLYSVYEKEYRLTTILPLEVYKLSYDELVELNLETSISYANAIMDKISALEADNALTENEKELIIESFNIETTEEVEEEDADGNVTKKIVPVEFPITAYFDKIRAFEEYNDISVYKELIKSFKYMDIVTTAMNYCLLERMNNEISECTFAEALIEMLEYYDGKGLDTKYMYDILIWYAAKLEGETVETGSQIDSEILDVYMTLPCSGEYTTDYTLEKQIAGQLVNATDEEIEYFISLPRIQYLNLTDNKLETLEGIEDLESLLGLYAYKNLLGDINDVNWAELKLLKELDLGYNQLSDISALEILTQLEKLWLTDNLLSGNFDFYLAGMGNLKEADFSHNQYSNISYLVNQYEFIAKNEGFDEVGEYLDGSINAPKVKFQYQTLSMKITIIKDKDYTMIELPRLFEQCEDLDHAKTSFGITSALGTVTADGKDVKLNTSKAGDYEACVSIEGRNGNEYTTEGIGYGTTCTINYTVIEEVVEPETPDTETPDTETPDTETPDTETPDTETPDTETPDTETPDTETPDTETPDTETPDTETPDTETPDTETPDTETPDTETPDTETPDTETPDTEVPVQEIEYGYLVTDTLTIVNTPEITVKTFIENLVSEEYTVTVLNENREVVTDTTILRTGYVVSIDKDGENLENLEVVVKGDVNGDGEVDALDTGIVRQVINDTRELVGVYAMAADVNSDGEINSADSLQILKYRAAKINAFED